MITAYPTTLWKHCCTTLWNRRVSKIA